LWSDHVALSWCFVRKLLAHWNLHTISEELKLPPESQVVSLVSCTHLFYSAPLGNQGQITYVAGNAYMETLALYLRSLGLPAGAWESKLVEILDGFVRPIKHENDIPLLSKANVEKLASILHQPLPRMKYLI
jgi:KR domain